MNLKTGKEPHVEHLHIPVGTNKISFGSTSSEFATVPVSELQRGGEVWIVRLAPSSEMMPAFIFWTEPRISKRGMVIDLAGYPELYVQDRTAYELEKSGAPRDVLIEDIPSNYGYGRAKRITFWEIEA